MSKVLELYGVSTCSDQKVDWASVLSNQLCPYRLLERSQVFLDCLHLLTLHEPGNELHIVPEVGIPGGSVDYFLVSAVDGTVQDFVGIELQVVVTR